MHSLRVVKRKFSFYIQEAGTKTLNQIEITFYDLNTPSISIYPATLYYGVWEQKVDRIFSVLKEFLVGNGMYQHMF